MDEENVDLSQLIDRAVKALFRECPTIVTRLAGMNTAAEDIRVEDPNLNLPELRADHVFVVPEGAIYLEYQLNRDDRLFSAWAAKWGGLLKQLGRPVVLVVLYLRKGNYATFPAQMEFQVGTFRAGLNFTAIRLWEHSERIRNGDLPELAPLLLLSENNPTEATLREEADLVRGANLPPETEANLLTIILMVASKSFNREWLKTLFEEKEIKTMKELGLIGDWIREGEARGKAEGEARGKAEGEARGKAETARRMTQRFLVKRFGTLPTALLERIEQADADWCDNLLDRAEAASNLSELADLYANAPE